MIQEAPDAVITDRFTARVLGALLLVLTLIIDVSSFLFVKPEVRASARFPLLVILPSLPLLVGGALLLRRAARMKEE